MLQNHQYVCAHLGKSFWQAWHQQQKANPLCSLSCLSSRVKLGGKKVQYEEVEVERFSMYMFLPQTKFHAQTFCAKEE